VLSFSIICSKHGLKSILTRFVNALRDQIEYEGRRFKNRLMLYTRLVSPVAVCIAKRGRNTRLAWLANRKPNPNPTNPTHG